MKKLKTQFDQNSLRPSLATPSCCCSCCCSCVISTITTSVLTSRSLYKTTMLNKQENFLISKEKKIFYTLLGVFLWPFMVALFLVLLITTSHSDALFLFSFLIPVTVYGLLLYSIKKRLHLPDVWMAKAFFLPIIFLVIEFFIILFLLTY